MVAVDAVDPGSVYSDPGSCIVYIAPLIEEISSIQVDYCRKPAECLSIPFLSPNELLS